MFREVAAILVEDSSDPSAPKDPYAKMAAIYFPHIAELSKRTGLPAQQLIDAWEKIHEEVEAAYPIDTPLKKFIRATVILFAHAKPEKT